MAELPRRVDLRLTIPAKAPFRELAVELAAKFAEYAGIAQTRVADVRAAVDAALSETTGESVELEMASAGRELVVTTGSTKRRASFPLTD